MSLRKKIIRLAYEKPQLREKLIPLVTASEGPHPLDPKLAIVYFGVITEDYNIEERAEEGDELAQSILDDPRKIVNLELQAVNRLQKLFKTRISNEGHDATGELICKFGVSSRDDIKKLGRILNRHHTGGDDDIDTGVEFTVARDFRFYPSGIRGRVFYGESPGAEGDLRDWLDDHS